MTHGGGGCGRGLFIHMKGECTDSYQRMINRMKTVGDNAAEGGGRIVVVAAAVACLDRRATGIGFGQSICRRHRPRSSVTMPRRGDGAWWWWLRPWPAHTQERRMILNSHAGEHVEG